MIKMFSTVILLFLLIPVDLSFSQTSTGDTKIYSGYLHHYGAKSKASLWHALFGAKSSKKEEILQDKQCSVEFRSTVAFSRQPVVALPEQLVYFIKFKNGAFDKFIINIYTNDDQVYSIDPDSDGKQVGINDEHHIFDEYLIYLVLGTDIDHLEVVSSSGESQDKYVLDKLEIRDNP